jgi:glycosyltransferase involved in cell wall biosynthesis
MRHRSTLTALLVDPSLFTAPYDTALTQGLVSANVDVMWATRPTRRGDRQELPLERTDTFFYRRTDDAAWLPAPLKPVVKGLAHLAGLATLLARVWSRKPDVVHVQWVVVPPFDVLAMALLRRWRPLVMTVHDTVPYNGQTMSWLQRTGYDVPMRCAHRLIVHTQSGRQALMARGVPAEKISVIAHGPLQLAVPPPAAAAGMPRDARWTFVLFGEIKPYKGLDLLIEAFALLAPEVREQARVIVAGRPRMDITPLIARIEALGLGAQFDLRPQRQSEEEMALLFAQADSFVFPYRQIDASGVYFLVKSLGKWLIASRVGIFAEDLIDGEGAALVPGGDVNALAGALSHAVMHRPRREPVAAVDSWALIGKQTRQLYEQAIAEFDGAPSWPARDAVK